MHVKAKTMAFGGLLLALSVVCMALGSVIETNTLFLLAAASYFVGIMIREFGMKTGIAFYAADVLLGFLIAPNRFYVLSFAGMGLYILLTEAVWRGMAKEKRVQIPALFWAAKYVIFNIMYIPVLLFFQEILFGGKQVSQMMWAGMLIGGQIGLLLYDRAYDYVQAAVWPKLRHRMLG